MNRDSAVRAWVVRGGKDGGMVQHNLDHEVMTLGWGYWLDPETLRRIQQAQLADLNELVKKLVKQQFPRKKPGTRGHISGRIQRFCVKIKNGDLVVLPLMNYGSDEQWIAIGEVQGPAWIDVELDRDARLRRRVDWMTMAVSESSVPEILRSSIQNRQAVVAMPNHAPQVLQKLCDRNMESMSGDEAGVRPLDEVPEGARIRVEVNRYERRASARTKCIEHYGTNCKVCGLDFEERYGELGRGFIQVHHVIPLSRIYTLNNYTFDPIKDLVPVCPNCHAMLHHKRKGTPLTVEELRQIIDDLSNRGD